MSLTQDYEDWQELVRKIKNSRVEVQLEDNILNNVEAMIDRDMLRLRDTMHVRYCLNGVTRKIEIEIDPKYKMDSEDPLRERIMLMKRHIVADLAEFLLGEVLGKVDPTKI